MAQQGDIYQVDETVYSHTSKNPKIGSVVKVEGDLIYLQFKEKGNILPFHFSRLRLVSKSELKLSAQIADSAEKSVKQMETMYMETCKKLITIIENPRMMNKPQNKQIIEDIKGIIADYEKEHAGENSHQGLD